MPNQETRSGRDKKDREDTDMIIDLRKKLAEKTSESEDVQEIAWRKIMKADKVQTLQKERHYNLLGPDGVASHPHATRSTNLVLGNFHPGPTSLNLEWSYSGQWQRVPKSNNQDGGPEYHSYNVGRLEFYLDTNGVLRRAVAYGDNSDQLLVWYDVEEMLKVMKWVIPDTSPWENSRR